MRPAGPDDVSAVRAVRLAALLDAPEAFGATYAEARAFDDARWLAMVRDGNFFLALVDDEAVAMASGGHHDDFPGTCWLYGMYVAPAHRGRGVGEALVERVGQWAREDGASELFLHVAEPIARARAFYRRVGFVETGATHTMHRDASVRLLTMVRRLD